MGVVDLFRKKVEKRPFTGDASNVTNAYKKAFFDYFNRFGVPLTDDLIKLVEYYSTNSVIYSLIDWKARKMSQIEPNLYLIKDKQSAKEFTKWNGRYTDRYELSKLDAVKGKAYQEIHFSEITQSSEYWKLKKLLTKPNDFSTFSELLYGYSAQMDASGFSLIWGHRVNKRGSVSWYLLPSHLMEAKGGNRYKPVTGYSVNYGLSDVEFKDSDTCHVKSFSFEHSNGGVSLYGTSKIKSALSELLTYQEAINRQYYGFKTGDTATLLFPRNEDNLPDSLATTTGLQEFKDSIFKGLRQKDRHKAAIVSMALDSIKLDSQLKDSVTLEAKKEVRQNISSIWHLSNRVVLNSSEGGSYNNLKEEIKTSLRDGVFPELRQLNQELNEFEIYPFYKNLELQFDYDVFPEFTADLATTMNALKGVDFLSDDEKRAYLNYDPLGLKNSNIPRSYWEKKNNQNV